MSKHITVSMVFNYEGDRYTTKEDLYQHLTREMKSLIDNLDLYSGEGGNLSDELYKEVMASQDQFLHLLQVMKELREI